MALLVDRDQIRVFVDGVFRYASDGTFISLRTFRDDGSDGPAVRIRGVKVNGSGLEEVIETAITQAQWAADHRERVVFCPPTAGFSSPRKADEAHLSEGYVLSVECDDRPLAARGRLEQVLGPATIVVASGGRWTDPETDEVEEKLHLYWRLKEPATRGDRARLKAARRLAGEIGGADMSNVTVVHPIRWPGSWHRKGEPQLARIVSLTKNEIDLTDALEKLEQARPAKPEAEAKAPHHDRQDERSTAKLTRLISSGETYHSALVSLAARQIGNGMKPDAVANSLRELMYAAPDHDDRWQSRFDDIPSIVASAQAKFGEAAELGGVITQDRVAQAFAERFAGKLRYDHHTGAWFEWADTHWRCDERARAFQGIRRLGRERCKNAKAAVRKEVGKAQFAAGVERFAQGDRAFAVTSEDWDCDPFLLGTPGGTVDLKTGEMRAAEPAEGITKLTAVAPAAAADCPRWRHFLAETFQDDAALIGFVQRYSGYCLTGDTREHALVFGTGAGGNGKGVLVNTISRIMADYAAAAAMDTLTACKFEKHTTDLAMLRGARLVTASETEEDQAWAEARIKQLTGGDPITARFMRQDNFTFRPEFKLFVVGNHTPSLRNVDEAMRRRLNIVPFNNKPVVPDRELDAKLKAEWPGILRWLIDGCLAWQKGGLQPPAIVQDTTRDYFDAQDSFGTWLDDACIVEPGNSCRKATTKTLFSSWSTYARDANDPPGTERSFADRLAKRGCARTRTSRRPRDSTLAASRGSSCGNIRSKQVCSGWPADAGRDSVV